MVTWLATALLLGTPGQFAEYEKNLLKPGAKAPDFTIENPKGGSVNLAKTLKGSKGVLLNFWFYG